MVRNKHNTPVIIKYPFWRMAAKNRSACYVCVNAREAFAPKEIRRQSLCLKADIGSVLTALR